MGFVSNIISKITGADDQADAIQQGAATQSAAAGKGISAITDARQSGVTAQQDALAALQAALAPYMSAGTGALNGQQTLLGLNGAGAQQSAIAGIQSSPQFGALQQQGNDAILANASATGGLRGGNTQGALAQFNQSLLAQQIQQQYANLGGLTSLGQGSAAQYGQGSLVTGQGIAGLNSNAATNIAQLFGQQGAATAGGQIAQGSVGAQGFGNLLSLGGGLIGAKKAGVF